jgi:hypothetical protein
MKELGRTDEVSDEGVGHQKSAGGKPQRLAALRHCWHFLVSSPWTFAASVPIIFLWILCLWVVLHDAINFSRVGWPGHHWSFYPPVQFPKPPGIHIPLLGEPVYWSLGSALLGLALMTLGWGGAVYIFTRDPNRKANRGS